MTKGLQTVKDVVKGVVDVQYMDGRIERTLKNGKSILSLKAEQGKLVVKIVKTVD